ncbi:MAG TPA: MBOAT family O-acyltransferase [Anaerovoracaceae bacterium]|nr:MBOAT family O-acyltransferase [Anaerovoracaceae bacterium]
MLFSSISFLYLFLPLVLLIYAVAPAGLKNLVLLVFSLFFYFCGEPVYTLLLIFAAVSNYIYSIFIDKYRGRGAAKVILVASVIINLGILCFFKYADFFIDSISLPIGISFFTFQTMSYTIDVYRQDVRVEKNLVNLSMYVTLFPQLIAGPIVRFSDIQGQIKDRKIGIESIYQGVSRFVFGLGKKVIIANSLGELCAAYTASDESTVLFAWLAAVCFALQLYFDFSGYSDMAIGLGKMFGFTFPENFNYPYISKSITEFWRRWHITLGRWFRDYVYIPLGGNRVSKGKWIRNVAIVWILTGFWHGAYWNFALWGAIYGVLLVVEKLWLGRMLDRLPAFVSHIYVILVILVTFVIFNGTSMDVIGAQLGAMIGLGGASVTGTLSLYYLKSYAVLILIGIVGATPLPKMLASKVTESAIGSKLMVVLMPAAVLAILMVVTAYLIDGSFNPFLYFRF